MTGRLKVMCCLAAQVLVAASCTEKGIDFQIEGRAKGKTFTVDNSGDAGQFVSMDIDVHDKVHMVYYDAKNKSLKYVMQSTAGFAIDTVDAKCVRCLYATLRVTGNGDPHVAYYSDALQTLMYAYREDGTWKREPIQWGRGAGMGARLLFDEERQLHAMYYVGDGYLMHAWRVEREQGKENKGKKPLPAAAGKKDKQTQAKEETAGVWGTERVDKANGSEKVQISFVRQPQGGLAASYLHWSGLSSELRIASKTADSAWSSQVIARQDNPGKSSALFFTPDGEPQIIFRVARKNHLALAKKSDQGWAITPLIDNAYNMALVSDATGNLLVAYEEVSGADPRKGSLSYAVRKGDKWSNFKVDTTPGSGTHLAATFTAYSTPVIAYYEERNHTLRLFVGE